METRTTTKRKREIKRLSKRHQRESSEFLAFEARESKRRRIDHKVNNLERDRLLSELKQKVRKLKEENATLRRDLELALHEVKNKQELRPVTKK